MTQLLDNFDIHLKIDFFLLIFLGIANTMPIVARHIFKNRFSAPIDFNKSFFDKKPILGTHKTWRGLLVAVVITSITSGFCGYGFKLGAMVGFYSMTGDLMASFIKRRLNLESGAKFTGVDQGIEAFFPVFMLKDDLSLSWLDCFFVTLVFTVVEITLSPFLYKIGFRRNPY